MPSDYKYANRDRFEKKRSPLRILIVLGAVLFLTSLILYGLYFIQTRNADELILTGQYQQAERPLNRWKWLPLVGARVNEKLGTSELLASGAEKASPYFQIVDKKGGTAPVAFWQDVLKVLWGNGRYTDGLAYATHIQSHAPEAQALHFYQAGFLTGLNRLPEASKELKDAGNLPDLSKEMSILRSEIDQRMTTGRYGLVFDRESLALVNVSVKGETQVLYDAVKPVFKNDAFDYLAQLQKSSGQSVLTLDYRIQSAALKALGKYAGAIVVLDPSSGDILAAASSPKGVNSEYPPDSCLALNQLYEPGSINKMITLSGALEHHVDISKIFPLQCEGNLKLSNDKVLYDWKTHGEVKDIDAATAVSCNVAFAKIGLMMKPSDLIENLKSFGYDSQLRDAFVPLSLGRLLEGDGSDEYLAHLSIGLDYLKMTPLHAAMLASSIANHGTAMMPRMLLQRRNVIGTPYDIQTPASYRQFMSAQTAQTVGQAMQTVITNPDGTGRRAAVEGFPFAMKTGTSGKGDTGYDAVVIGFGPVPNAKIAFAIVLEHAGKAEFEGARVTKLFLESIQGYIK